MYKTSVAPNGNAVESLRISTGFAAALKLYGGAGMSLETGSHIYVYAPNYITLKSDAEVNLHNAYFYTATGNKWRFGDTGIYYISGNTETLVFTR